MSAPTTTKTPGRLPAQPLMTAVQHRGGLGELLAGRRTTKEGRWAARAYARACASGWVSLGAGDQLACRLLGVHPVAVWGEAFWRSIEPPTTPDGGPVMPPRRNTSAGPRHVTGAIPAVPSGVRGQGRPTGPRRPHTQGGV